MFAKLYVGFDGAHMLYRRSVVPQPSMKLLGDLLWINLVTARTCRDDPSKCRFRFRGGREEREASAAEKILLTSARKEEREIWEEEGEI